MKSAGKSLGLLLSAKDIFKQLKETIRKPKEAQEIYDTLGSQRQFLSYHLGASPPHHIELVPKLCYQEPFKRKALVHALKAR